MIQLKAKMNREVRDNYIEKKKAFHFPFCHYEKEPRTQIKQRNQEQKMSFHTQKNVRNFMPFFSPAKNMVDMKI